MGRPKRVFPGKLSEYNKLHTRKVKMYSGVELNALHLIKETEKFYMGFESWAFCCGNFKGAKKNTELKFEIPTLTDEKAIEFLNQHSWKDWVDRELAGEKGKGDMTEAMTLLAKLFPDKKKIYFFEFKSIISGFCNGTFISYDDNGAVKEPHEFHIKRQRQYTFKYNQFCLKTDELKVMWNAYGKESDKDLKNDLLHKYFDAAEEYAFTHCNLTGTFIKIGEHAVVMPCAFTRPSVEGMSYEHSGEIYFIETPDAVYFEIERHY